MPSKYLDPARIASLRQMISDEWRCADSDVLEEKIAARLLQHAGSLMQPDKVEDPEYLPKLMHGYITFAFELRCIAERCERAAQAVKRQLELPELVEA
jgi:hypothetical protein